MSAGTSESSDASISDDGCVVRMHERIDKLEDVQVRPNVVRVNLRQNRITEISPVPWLAQLEELDLYDNGISEINNLDSSTKLKFLDLSFNRISKISGLTALKNLEQLYLISNGIAKIEGLPQTETLRYLELGANRISAIEGLEGVPNVQELFFGQNRITSMLGLSMLKHLRIVSVQSNRLTKIEGLAALADSLEELYLSHNQITDLPLDEFEGMHKLRILDVSGNRISQIPKGFGAGLPELEEFWASDNQLDNLVQQLDSFDMACAQRLTTVYLAGSNPMSTHPRYIAVVKQSFPALKQIDGTILSWE